MKRPEGFDAPPPTEPRASASSGERPSRAARERTPRAPRAPRPVRTPPERPRPAARAATPIRPSADRTAQAELRAAERARRRAERAELRRFTRRTRRRRIAWLTGLGVVAALVALSLAAVYSPVLALREIRVEGARSLDPAEVVAAIDGQLGTPLALLDEEELRDQLGTFTVIRSYATEILPPGTLIVHIVERTPVGVMVSGAQFDTVDAAGVVLASSAKRPEGLPLIVLGAAQTDGPAFAAVAEVLLALPRDVAAEVDSITATTRDDVTLTLGSSGQRVVWGSAADSDHKARVLAALVAIHGDAGAGVYDVSAPGTAVFHQG